MIKLYKIRKDTFAFDVSQLGPVIGDEICRLIFSEYKRVNGPFNLTKGDLEVQMLNVDGFDDCFILHIQKHNEQDDKLKFLGEISTNLFHEVNGPLNVMISGLEILKMEMYDELPPGVVPQIQTRLDVFELGLVKFCNIIRGLQSFSQGKHEFKKIQVDKFNKTTIDFANVFLNKSNIKLSYKNSMKTDCLEMSDTLMSQVLINLIKNAADQIKDYPSFNKWIELSMNEDDNFAYYRVKDGGKGIPEPAQKQLFSYGFTTKAVGQGTGIGLSFCKKIISQHRGEIYYDKTASNTTFVIKLPKCK